LRAAEVKSERSARPPSSASPGVEAPSDAAFERIGGFPGAVFVRGVPKAAQITVDATFVCALTQGGEEWCWRDDDASPIDGEPPVGRRPSLVPSEGALRDISGPCRLGSRIDCFGSRGMEQQIADATALSKDGAGCAVLRDGRVACWYEPSPWDDVLVAGEVPAIRGAREVSLGRFGACAIEDQGHLVCWGAASLIPWEPGSGGWTPPPATGPTLLRGIDDVAHVSLRDGFHCLVRKTGKVLCWFPEDAATVLPQNPLPPGAEVRGIEDAVAIFGKLVIDGHGALRALTLEFDARGQLDVVAVPVGSGVLGDVVAADGSLERGCAVLRDGGIACWAQPQ